MQLRVMQMTIPVVFGYQFLAGLQPHIDWRRLMIRIWRKEKAIDVAALPAAYSYRMVTPTTGVLEAEIRMLSPSLIEWQCGADTVVRDRSAEVGIVDSEHTEEVGPTPDVQNAVARSQEVKWKSRRKLRNSPRKEVEKLMKEVYHTRCVHPVCCGARGGRITEVESGVC